MLFKYVSVFKTVWIMKIFVFFILKRVWFLRIIKIYCKQYIAYNKLLIDTSLVNRQYMKNQDKQTEQERF